MKKILAALFAMAMISLPSAAHAASGTVTLTEYDAAQYGWTQSQVYNNWNASGDTISTGTLADGNDYYVKQYNGPSGVNVFAKFEVNGTVKFLIDKTWCNQKACIYSGF